MSDDDWSHYRRSLLKRSAFAATLGGSGLGVPELAAALSESSGTAALEGGDVIDDFEDGDLDEWTVLEDGPDGDPPRVASTTRLEGDRALELTADNGPSRNSTVTSTGGLPDYPAPGTTW